jgi:hypothetical protein
MTNNSNTRQPRLISHQAVYSLILGVISIILPWLMVWYNINFIPVPIFLPVLAIAAISAIIGLVFGKEGLRSHKKRPVIAGLSACAIGLLSCIYVLVAWLMIAGWQN